MRSSINHVALVKPSQKHSGLLYNFLGAVN